MLYIEIPQGVLYSISALSCTTLCMYFSVERLLKSSTFILQALNSFQKAVHLDPGNKEVTLVLHTLVCT